jgi:carbon starvation protein
MWPFLFITVACGAISGFHCMVSGGTTSRQLARESHVRKVAFNAMLLESLLGILVILAMASSIKMSEYMQIVWPQSGSGNPIFAFALAAGTLFQTTLGIPLAIGCVFGILTVEGFIVTTLDTAVRLNRYLFEELWDIAFRGKTPAYMKHYWFNAALSALLMLLFATYIPLNLGWLLFGTANQLVSALALIVITAWLLSYGRRFLYTLIPAVLMLATTMTALVMEIVGTHPVGQKKNALYETSAIFMAILAAGVILVAIRTFLFRPRQSLETGIRGAEAVAEAEK